MAVGNRKQMCWELLMGRGEDVWEERASLAVRRGWDAAMAAIAAAATEWNGKLEGCEILSLCLCVC